jgi:hypothetical protein
MCGRDHRYLIGGASAVSFSTPILASRTRLRNSIGYLPSIGMGRQSLHLMK